jgi:glyoxylase-like metal-dependent hydrolase (beta-lactamase superfamily II)
VARGIVRLRTLMVNLFFVSNPDRSWVLVDAGMPGYSHVIMRTAASLFGSRRPSAIVLTHGHFDHVGSVLSLMRAWSVPVYAHRAECPFLDGTRSYPPPDPSVGGGAMSWLSFAYPRGPIEIGDALRSLPEDGSVPMLEGWRWVHTPGHSPGHVALHRSEDRVVIAGDAVITTRQESATAVLMQRLEVRPPPAYFTIDWTEARESVRTIAALQPEILTTGHGPTARGASMRQALDGLIRNFTEFMPRTGRYVHQPAHPERRPAPTPQR